MYRRTVSLTGSFFGMQEALLLACFANNPYLCADLQLNCNFVKCAYMDMINRDLKLAIEAALPYFPVITVTGPRQSGKTTLCRNLFRELPYINLEKTRVREAVMLDTEKYLYEYPDGLIIDEAQQYPDLFSYIQVAVDENPSRRYILTGSSNFSLLEKITQSLAGRTALFTLLPLSLHELGDRKHDISTDTLILNGGYPAVWAKNTPRELFYGNYYSTYIERDVRQIIHVKDVNQFQTFIRLTAGRIGTECNAAALSNEVGVVTNTIKQWFSVLAASYIIYMLPPYYENIGKRLVKSPKVYFYDTALACYLLGIETEAQLAVHPLRGALFENMVVNEALKERYNAGKRPDLFFYRDRSQKEVDLIQTKANDLHLYEIKSSKTYHKEFYKGIDYLKNIFGERITRSALIFDGDTEIPSVRNGVYNFRDFRLME
ncbi:MAG: ATP-binding protein, partial [Tannerella sp.]|jgi:predicted AAA+ superfamily ATPase|nr:ATP-binding protein [Tannerella sp.]